MAENVQEPVYLNYGQSQISQQDFLNSAANQVQNYVAKQPWSSKRKELFMKAYSDIMNLGVTGAYNDTGNWEIEYNGNINLDNLSKKEREMYGEAAYFIQQQMSSITPKAVEDETKKEELPIFTNEVFNTGLEAQLGKKYGGRDYSQAEWNERDVTNEYGIRETQQRANVLAEVLTNYANSLEDGKYTFEGSPYSDLSTLKNKMLNAAQQLRDGTWTADTLNELGINPEQYLSTGENDVDENGLTRKQKMELDIKAKADELAAKQKAEADEKALKIKQENELIRSNPFSKVRIRSGFNNMKGWSVNQIANQYTIATLTDKLNELSGKADWTPDEQSLIAGAYKHAEKVPISQQEYNVLKRMTTFKDAPKSRFSKIAGVDGMIYDSASGRLILAGETAAQPTDWLAGKSDKDSREKYLKSSKDGLTSAEWEELASIGFDIASIVDPEMISSAGLALTGSGLRTHAMMQQPGGPSKSDWWWNAADWGLSILGSIPVLGDSALAARAVNNLKKAIVPLGVVMAGANVPQAAKAAYNKVVNGQDLTIQDWRAIGAVLTAAVGVGRGRQMSKRAEALRKTGGTTSKNVKEGVIKTSEGEIKVDETTAKQLKEQFKGADGATRTQKLRQNTKVQEAARQQGVDLSKAEVQGHGRFSKSPVSYTPSTSTISGNRIATLRAMSEFNRNHGWLARKGLAEQDWVFRHTGGYDSKPNVGLWQNIKNFFGKSEWDNFGKTNNTRVQNQANTPVKTESSSPKQEVSTSGNEHHLHRQGQLKTALENRIKGIESGKIHHKPDITKDVKLDLGSENIDVKVTNGRGGQKYYKVRSKDGDKEITYPATSNVETLQKQIAEVVKRQHERLDMEKVREIRRIFGLKHGGVVEQEPNLQDTIQNFLNKQK